MSDLNLPMRGRIEGDKYVFREPPFDFTTLDAQRFLQWQGKVMEFHLAMGIPVADKPALLTDARQALRFLLIKEEAEEFLKALAEGDYLEQVDALCDVLYVTFGAALELGVDLGPFFDEVQRANMRKVGGPIREDGKQLKPDGWKPPNHRAVFASLYGNPVPGENG